VCQLAQVLSFSGVPFLAVTALANSGLGRWLNQRLEQSRQRLEAEGLLQDVEEGEGPYREVGALLVHCWEFSTGGTPGGYPWGYTWGSRLGVHLGVDPTESAPPRPWSPRSWIRASESATLSTKESALLPLSSCY